MVAVDFFVSTQDFAIHANLWSRLFFLMLLIVTGFSLLATQNPKVVLWIKLIFIKQTELYQTLYFLKQDLLKQDYIAEL